MRYVIIGNGVAAAGCIEGIRSVDKETPITVISEENYPVYARPLISYYLEGKTDLSRMLYRKPDFYEKNGCEVLYGAKAARLDVESKKVVLTTGEEIPYKAVCVATGSSPFVPPFKGLETVKNRFSFMTLDDTLALEQAIDENSRVFIVGAGLIGLKCAEGLLHRVKSVTVCDLAPRVLSSVLDEESAAIMQKHLEDHSMQFYLGDTVTEFAENKAILQSGTEVEFDVLVVCVGVRANTSLVKDAGGNVNRGILVNERMETSLPFVYAAGDCTEGFDLSLGANRVLAILPNAYMQGKCAGINMAGGEKVFQKAIPMNSIGFFGLYAMTAGTYTGPEQGGEVYVEPIEGGIKKFFVKDGVLKGYILIGYSEQTGVLTALIRDQTPLDTVNFPLLRKSVTFAAFSPEDRRKKFGGVV